MSKVNVFVLSKAYFLLLVISAITACSTASGPIRIFDPAAVQNDIQINRILVPPEIEVLAIDGIEVKTPFITDGYNEIQLLPGKHKIAVSYEKLWGDGTSSMLIRSHTVIIEVEMTTQQTYYLKYPVPTDTSEADSLASQFQPWLETAQQERVASTSSRVNKSGFLGRFSNSTKTNALASTKKAVSAPAAANTTVNAEEIVARQKPVERLKFWWKLADKADRVAFERWLINNR